MEYFGWTIRFDIFRTVLLMISYNAGLPLLQVIII